MRAYVLGDPASMPRAQYIQVTRWWDKNCQPSCSLSGLEWLVMLSLANAAQQIRRWILA